MDNQNYNQLQHNEVTVGEWLITMLIMLIPIVNIIMMFVWAFGSGTQPSKANYFKAALIFLLIAIILQVIFFVIFGAAMFAGLSSYGY
jgi:membrane protein YdbS with pleckstrin-like domain